MTTTGDDRFPTTSFAARLRQLRIAAGFTLQDLSARTHYSKGHLSKIENGKAPSIELARKCDAELHADGALLALVAAPTPTASLDYARSESSSVLPLADGRTAGPPLAEYDPEDHERNLQSFEQILALMRTLGQTLGPSNIMPMLETHMRSLLEISARTDDWHRIRFLGIAARFAEFTGWMAQESGDDLAALRWTDKAVELAGQAGDADLLAYAFVRKALVSLYRQDWMTTIKFAQQAQRMKCSRGVLRQAAQREAQGHALAGDIKAFEEAIARAAALMTEPEPAETSGPPLGTSNIKDPVALARGWSLYDLGRIEEAAAILGEVWKGIPPHSHRARARVGARYALALVQCKKLDTASEVLEPILRILPSIESATIEADVRLVARRLSAWQSHPDVKRVLPALSAALSARVPQQSKPAELRQSA